VAKSTFNLIDGFLNDLELPTKRNRKKYSENSAFKFLIKLAADFIQNLSLQAPYLV
tara:strand:- start:140137 stop:140304 length:168 start_codon:yes stop_codon:yes gene_type:complete